MCCWRRLKLAPRWAAKNFNYFEAQFMYSHEQRFEGLELLPTPILASCHWLASICLGLPAFGLSLGSLSFRHMAHIDAANWRFPQ